MLRALLRLSVPLALLSAPAQAQDAAPATYTNPILWADYSDPDVIRVGDRYYMVSSSFHLSPGLPVLESADLISWRIIGHVLPRLPFGPLYDMPGPHTLTDAISKPIGGTKYASGPWAPAIRHHAGKFWVYVATPDEGIFMMQASDPAGPWSAPVAVKAEPGLEDPCPFWDDDGTAWLIHGKVGAGPLILHRMAPDGTRVLDEGIVVAEDKARLPVLEGPKLYKRDGWYYIFAPIGGVSTGPQAVGRARSITGPYEWRDVLLPTDTIRGPHQGGYVEDAAGQGWFAHFNSTGAFGRITHLQPVRWQDGWPVMGDAAPGAIAGTPVSRHAAPITAPDAPRFTMQAEDEFSDRQLGLQWQWNHNPDDDRWSLTERPGHMRLRAAPARHLVTARNTLTQMLVGPRMVMTAAVDLSQMADGQRAGLALFGVRPSWVGAVREGGTTRLAFASEGQETLGPPLPHQVWLRADVGPDQRAHYSWSADGARFEPFGAVLELSQFSWWRGSRPALFTYTHGQEAAGLVDVDFFRVERPQ
ncbi:xylan 1,4-beta-xylosidase [Croceibacterium mercuriale]|uniref:Xylan 1,4-beta-xylosidase n=1 Tax=Croceibacterium mercuriale TaxID=1572751 RepID=A0A0B2BV16_9SPHN|nr:glycoside hydrolase 43 family protein [Croceibacterium mercuriale]KHL25468.1 xylan 1,4-beta-xylosidase [Croceibacterium mercuriale]